MRLFIGLQLRPEEQKALFASVSVLQQKIEARFVPPELYHITLAYLGEREERALDALHGLLACAAQKAAPFSLLTQNVDYFGSPSNAILYARIQATEPLWGLNTALRDLLHASNEPFDDKPLIPHITVARKARLLAPIPALQMPSESIAVRSVTLFHSARIEGSLHYVPLFSLPLASNQKECFP